MTAKRINWPEYHKTQAELMRETAAEYRKTAALLTSDPLMAEFCIGRAIQNEAWAAQEDSMSEAAR